MALRALIAVRSVRALLSPSLWLWTLVGLRGVMALMALPRCPFEDVEVCGVSSWASKDNGAPVRRVSLSDLSYKLAWGESGSPVRGVS